MFDPNELQVKNHLAVTSDENTLHLKWTCITVLLFLFSKFLIFLIFSKVLISGAQVPIDVEDLRSHTSYSGMDVTCDTKV